MKIRNKAYWTFLLFVASLVTLMGYMIYDRMQEQMGRRVEIVVEEVSQKLLHRMHTEMDRVLGQGHVLAAYLEDGAGRRKADADGINKVLQNILEENQSLSSCFILLGHQAQVFPHDYQGSFVDEGNMGLSWNRETVELGESIISRPVSFAKGMEQVRYWLSEEKWESLLQGDIVRQAVKGQVVSLIPVRDGFSLLGVVGLSLPSKCLQDMLEQQAVAYQMDMALVTDDSVLARAGSRISPVPYGERKYGVSVSDSEQLYTLEDPFSGTVYKEQSYFFDLKRVSNPWKLVARKEVYPVLKTAESRKEFLVKIMGVVGFALLIVLSYVSKLWKLEKRKRELIAEDHKHTTELLDGILENSDQMMMFVIDRDYQLLSCNREFGRFMEMSTAHSPKKGDNLQTIVRQSRTWKQPQEDERQFDLAKLEYYIERVLDGETFSTMDYYGEFCFEQFYSPLRSKEGKVIGVTCLVADITELKDTEERLYESERKFKQMFEEAGDGIVLYDDNSVVKDCNDTFAKMLGYDSPQDIKGMTPYAFVEKKRWSKLQKHLRQQQVEGVPFTKRYESVFVRKDGSHFVTEGINMNSYDNKGNFQGSWSIHRDISDRKRVEGELSNYRNQLEELVQERTEEIMRKKQELRRKNEEILQKNERTEKAVKELEVTLKKQKAMQAQLVSAEKMVTLGQLTAGIAHEINNPINFVYNNVSPLKEDVIELGEILKEIRAVGLTEAQEEVLLNHEATFLYQEILQLLDGIEEGATRTANIVKELKLFSRTNDQKREEVPLEAGLDATLLLINNKLKNRIAVCKDYGDTPKVKCNPGKVNQVFMNILVNAAQAIEGEGEISISTREVEKDGRPIVSVKIQDTGVGMPEEMVKHIFEPFYTTKSAGEGSGLGLSISSKIIREHSGWINVHSEAGKGTTFDIELPVAGV